MIRFLASRELRNFGIACIIVELAIILWGKI